MKTVIKRDGREVAFDSEKVRSAIRKAFFAVDGEVSSYAEEKANNISRYIEELEEDTLTVEDVQDYVENGLMASKRKDVARAYIKYRDERSRARGNLTDNTLIDYLAGNSEYWNKENSNKDAKVVTTQRDYIAGITSTDIARRFLLPKDVCEAHDAGIIHQHDIDYALQRALTNCSLINLEDMLQNGTIINGVKIDPQKRLSTATTVTTQIITAVASSQYGGCTISLTHLAPFVRKSGEFYQKKYLDWGMTKEQADKFASLDLAREVKDAVQTFNYQINSMSTTNG